MGCRLVADELDRLGLLREERDKGAMSRIKVRIRLKAALLAVAIGLAPASSLSGTTLRFIPQADLRSIDPIWTTAYVTRNFGYLVFDTLFSLDKDFKPQPQMVDRWT